MFTFIKKVIKTGAPTSSYPLEPIAVDKNFRGKPEHNPQQCIGCAACVNACPSNALSVETDLACGEQAWQFNLGRCIFAVVAKRSVRRRPLPCPRPMNWRYGRKKISCNSRALRCVNAASAPGPLPCKKRSTTPSPCCNTTATPVRTSTGKASKPARTANVRNAWCRQIGSN